MIKRKSVQSVPRGFRKLVKESIPRYAHLEPSSRWDALVGEAQDYFIKKLGLPEQKEKEVKRLESHSLSLMVANTKITQGRPITVKMARTIFTKCLEEIPALVRAHEKRLSAQHLQQLKRIEEDSRKNLEHLKSFPETHLVPNLNPDFITRASEIHSNIVSLTLLEKYDLYERTKLRAIEAIAAELEKTEKR